MGEGCREGGGVVSFFCCFNTVPFASFKQLLLFSEWDFLLFSFTFFYRGDLCIFLIFLFLITCVFSKM